MERVNTPLSEAELAAVRLSAQRGKPLGDTAWVESIAHRLKLDSTIRPRGSLGGIPPNEFALRCADSASVAALPPLHQHSEEKTFTQTVLS